MPELSEAEKVFLVLEDRHRSAEHPERGRMTREDVEKIIKASRKHYEELISTAPEEETPGARFMVHAGVLTLCAYRAIREFGTEKDHAIELTGDLSYKQYKSTIAPTQSAAQRAHRDPSKQMEFMQKFFLEYTLAAPGYDVTVRDVPGAIAYDITRCPVHDYFKAFGPEELELFQKTWCKYDYAIAEFMVKGGKFTMSKCLSNGDGVCDMQWMAE